MPNNTETRTIAISKELADEVLFYATDRRRSEGRVVTMREIAEQALQEYLDRHKAEQKAQEQQHG